MEPGNLIFLKLPRYSKVHWDLRTTILPSYPNILSWVQRRDNSLGSTYPTQPSHIPQGVVTNYRAGLLALIWQLNMMWRVRQGKDRGLDREVQCRRGTGVSWGTGFQLSQTHHPSKPKSTLTQKAVLRHCHALSCLSASPQGSGLLWPPSIHLRDPQMVGGYLGEVKSLYRRVCFLKSMLTAFTCKKFSH